MPDGPDASLGPKFKAIVDQLSRFTAVDPPPFGGPNPDWLLSPWGAPTWIVRSQNPAMGKATSTIRFSTPSSTGVRLTDLGNESWLVTCKWICWTWGSANYRSVVFSAYWLCKACLWAIDNEKSTLRDLTRSELCRMRWELCQRSRSSSRHTSQILSKSSVVALERVLRMLFDAGPSRLGNLPDWITVNPVADTPQILRRIKAAIGTDYAKWQSGGSTRTIPDDVALEYLKTALRYVEEYAGPLLALREKALEIRDDARRHGTKEGNNHSIIYAFFGKDLPDGSNAEAALDSARKAEESAYALIERLSLSEQRKKKTQQALLVLKRFETEFPTFSPHNELTRKAVAQEIGCINSYPHVTTLLNAVLARRRLEWRLKMRVQCSGIPRIQTFAQLLQQIVFLQTACCSIILTFSAFRISEACSAEIDCIAMEPDGPWMTTTVIKLPGTPSEEPRPVPAIVARACDIFLDTSKPYRGDNRRLLLTSQYGTIGVEAKREAWNLRFKEFARICFAHPHAGAERTLAAKWEFANHQFRRFFAMFYVRRFEGNLGALSYHLRHIDQEMVWAYLRDPENVRYYKEARHSFSVDVITAVCSGRVHSTGRGAGFLKTNLPSLQGKVMSPAAAARHIDAAIKREGLFLTANETGYCLGGLRRAAIGLCSMGEGGEPNEINRTPELCDRCANNLLTDRSVDQLKADYVVHKELSESPSATSVMKEATCRRMKAISIRLAELESGSD
jgi:integrase